MLVMLFLLGTASAFQWAIASLAISMAVAGAGVWIVSRFYGFPLFSLPLFLEKSGEGFVFSISGSTTSVYNDIDKVVLSHDGMNAANGIYSMAYRVINIGTMPVMSLVGAAMPRFFSGGSRRS